LNALLRITKIFFIKLENLSCSISWVSSVKRNSIIGKNSSIKRKAVLSDGETGAEFFLSNNANFICSSAGVNVSVYNNTIIRDCSLGDYVKIRSYNELNSVKMGAYSYTGHYTKINNCIIGKYCSIGPDVKIGLGIHPVEFISTHPAFYSSQFACNARYTEKSYFVEHQEVIIGNDVWIGSNALIMDGIKIGNGAIVAAGAIVNKDVGDYEIVAGIPAKIVRKRFDEETIEYLMQTEWWNKSEEFIRKNIQNFQSKVIKKDLQHFSESND
jgi:acetyltransferase-like isoleucine patch superfamily enzyme